MSGGEIGDIAEDTTTIEVEERKQMVLGWVGDSKRSL